VTARVPIGPLFREPHVLIQALLYERLADAGFSDIRPAHGCVFGHLAPDGSTVTEIARLARLTKATVVAAVDDLERLGYAERVPDPRDRRAKIVHLTARGQKATAAAEEIFDGIEQELDARIGSRVMLHLRALLEPLHASLLQELAHQPYAAGPKGRATRGVIRQRSIS
jgi:DNA-binding MarR family transcriptional regulator